MKNMFPKISKVSEPTMIGERGKQIRSVVMMLSRFMVLILLVVVLSVISPSFLTISNMINILRQTSLLFVLAAGMTLVILTGGIDLSMGSVLGLAGCLGAMLIKSQGNLIGIAGALAVGLLFGLVNGSMVVYIGLPSFLVTYGTMQIARGLAIAVMRGNVIWGFDPSFRSLGAGSFMGIPTLILSGIGVFILIHFVLSYTTFGRKIYLVGDNAPAAIHAGVNVKGTTLYVYALAGIISAFSGLMYVARLNSAEAGLGNMFELDAIAAAVMGGTSIVGGRGTVFGTVIGALIITLLRNALNLLGVSSLWQPFVIGFCIVLAVLTDQILSKEGGNEQEL